MFGAERAEEECAVQTVREKRGEKTEHARGQACNSIHQRQKSCGTDRAGLVTLLRHPAPPDALACGRQSAACPIRAGRYQQLCRYLTLVKQRKQRKSITTSLTPASKNTHTLITQTLLLPALYSQICVMINECVRDRERETILQKEQAVDGWMDAWGEMWLEGR